MYGDDNAARCSYSRVLLTVAPVDRNRDFRIEPEQNQRELSTKCTALWKRVSTGCGYSALVKPALTCLRTKWARTSAARGATRLLYATMAVLLGGMGRSLR